MYYRNDIIGYLQSNNILALKLDHALAGARNAVANQINRSGRKASTLLHIMFYG